MATAQRDRESASSERKPLLAIEDGDASDPGLFVGLSFPVVPSTKPAPVRTQPQTSVAPPKVSRLYC